MGSSSSKNRKQEEVTHEELNQVMEQMRKNYEELLKETRNQRSVESTNVSKDEFEQWKNEQQLKFNELEEMVEKRVTMKYDKLLTEKDILIADLEKQVNSLTNSNATLEGKLLHISSTQTVPEQLKLRELSRAKVDEFVETLLKDENVNISYLPDWVERKIYKNVLNLILGLLDNTFNSTSVKLLGHLLTVNIVPDTSSSTNCSERNLEIELQKEEVVDQKEEVVEDQKEEKGKEEEEE